MDAIENMMSPGQLHTWRHIKLLLWKRKLEYMAQKSDIAKVVCPPLFFMLMMVIMYESFGAFLIRGGLEEYFMPMAMWLFVQKVCVSIAYEKHAKLLESMRMMGMKEVAYWFSYFISDGVIIGFFMSLMIAIMSIGPAFRYDNVGEVFGFFWLFYIASVPFASFVVSLFDTPQNASQACLGVLLALYVVYLALGLSIGKFSSHGMQTTLCFFPPIALQLACGAYKLSYVGISVSTICLILFADIFIYSFLAWYITQVRPSEFGVAKPFWFIFDYNYWFGNTDKNSLDEISSPIYDAGKDNEVEDIPIETVNEAQLGKPKVCIGGLRKTFGQYQAVKGIKFDMYENQIFALLGHNGAGKTTTINMLTGLMPADSNSGDTTIYGSSIFSSMDDCRKTMGVCPQHDVLFPLLTVEEHILFFSQLKGYNYQDAKEDVKVYTDSFNLKERLDHLGHELSGGQRRKLSVSIAVCGGSKFVVLDEPTAGMDPVARRELWDLMKELRKSHTILLTTHYMDEADTLGNRIGIMNLGKLQCLGSPQYLKKRYGAGYQLVISLNTIVEGGKIIRDPKVNINQIKKKVQETFPGCKAILGDIHKTNQNGDKSENLRKSQKRLSRKSISEEDEDADSTQIVVTLPFDAVNQFGQFFNYIEKNLKKLGIETFGVTITSLEDVFLEVGGDHSVVPDFTAYGEGISNTKYEFNLMAQITGIMWRKINNASNDLIAWTTILFPTACVIVASALYSKEVISSDNLTNNIVNIGIFCFSFLMVPGLLAEFIVRERELKLRTVLTVMGCDFRAYWIGTFLADFALLSIVIIVTFSTWFVSDMHDFYSTAYSYFLVPIFVVQIIAFGYIMSYVFTTPKSCVFTTPNLIMGLLITPNIILGLIVLIFDQGLGVINLENQPDVTLGIILWGLALLTPYGNYFAAMLDASYDISGTISAFPPVYACMLISLIESAIFLGISYHLDTQAVLSVMPKEMGQDEIDHEGIQLMHNKKNKNNDVEAGYESDEALLGLDHGDKPDSDVMIELRRVKELKKGEVPLRVNGLRKIFLPKTINRKAVAAARGVHFAVKKNEIFGLLGANGAGKTTTMNMITRYFLPTSGDAEIGGVSCLSNFSQAATHLGVVTQDNSLWDLISVEDHLKLFARLRGVPESEITNVVLGVVNQLELMPHRSKLAGRLSGGMKRKLCVAIALIGNPEVCLLDEPSAGLDPVSRRNLWEVILRTMEQRAVVLTTHSMEEAEALCDRIGIMVFGQLRALGTKQQLKSKFGANYELVVKLGDDSVEGDEQRLDAFVLKLFPSAKKENDNGLITYTIQRKEMSLAKAFSEFEKNRLTLHVENYSVSQPTLERVFIDTVAKHQAQIQPGIHKTMSRHSSVDGRSSSVVNDMRDPNETRSSELVDNNVLIQPVNVCGCTIFVTRLLVVFFTIGLLVFWVLLGAVGSTPAVSIMWSLFFMATVVQCIIWQCACCGAPKEEE
jgi:ATP-binding cassette, subfamily A (ABC1), member 3